MRVNNVNNNQNFGHLLSPQLYNKIKGHPWNSVRNIYKLQILRRDIGTDTTMLDLAGEDTIRIIYPKMKTEFSSRKTFVNMPFRKFLQGLKMETDGLIDKVLEKGMLNGNLAEVSAQLQKDIPQRARLIKKYTSMLQKLGENK